MEYKAIECGNVDELNIEINKMLENGWVPIGGVSVSLSETDEAQYFVATQAMTRDVVGIKST